MNNYDHNIIGIGNPSHPANEDDFNDEELEPTNLSDAFRRYKETGDEDMFKSAIDFHNEEIQSVIKYLTNIVGALREEERNTIANYVCNQLNKLKELVKWK